MSIPAINVSVYNTYWFENLSTIKPNIHGDDVQTFAWIVSANEDVSFNFKGKFISSGSTNFDAAIYELRNDGTSAIVSNWPGRMAGANVYGPTYVMGPAPVNYIRTLIFTVSNTVGNLEFKVWTT